MQRVSVGKINDWLGERKFLNTTICQSVECENCVRKTIQSNLETSSVVECERVYL